MCLKLQYYVLIFFTSGKYQRAELKKKIWDELRFDDLLFAAT